MAAFFGIFLLLLATGVPIALALGIGGVAFLWLSGNEMMILQLPQRMMAGVNQFVLLTIPLFLLAGTLMNVAGITDRIVGFARATVGHRRGGMSSVTVLSAGFFAGISGSANAEAAALGSILIPTMRKQGIPAAYAAALVGVCSIVGPIIPPSITMIIYGVLSGTSIGQLFLAGVIPGVLLIASFLVYVTWRARRDGFPLSERVPWAERRGDVVRALPALFLPVIIIVGIKAGVFTPTEAAAVAVTYALIVGLAYRDLTVERIWHSLVITAIVSSAILFITSVASIVAFVFTLEQVPTRITEMVLSITENKLAILLLLNLFLLLLGMFLEPISILILAMPVLLKIGALLGMDPVHFGTMVVLNVVIGMATPPVGIQLFIVAAASGEPLIRIVREALPLIGICIVVLALVALIPPLTLFLPNAFVPVN
ncbi:TRAP transporter large permease [Chelativorans sp. SCAU2101]|uniref:TRAP transporter large permease protein n=1 Tax=Chelativorans petroleitrophicus TaxID=2975484 RepID=A0A9X3B576_9HYPH|nr:TRAP transporter large permease [Chelativorans petroleitrophicus]MCT8988703.1 TRAP transporter large permease [Chelativorans petroleitrophicus]